MSGGHWEYCGFRIQTDLLAVAEDPDVAKRWPLIAAAIEAFGTWFQDAEHEMDYDLSGDTRIAPDETFNVGQFGLLLAVLLKIAPDEWFPRGKWATIQAVQARMEEAR